MALQNHCWLARDLCSDPHLFEVISVDGPCLPSDGKLGSLNEIVGQNFDVVETPHVVCPRLLGRNAVLCSQRIHHTAHGWNETSEGSENALETREYAFAAHGMFRDDDAHGLAQPDR